MDAITVPIAQRMASHISRGKPLDVLEVGCGERSLASAVPSATWTGIDVDAIALSRSISAQRRAVADMTAIPFPAESFDALLSFSTLQYVDHDAAFAEFARVLRPNGMLLLGENLSRNPIARMFRLMTALGEALHGCRTVTKQYIEPATCCALAKHFHSISSEPFYLLTPLLFVLRPQPSGSRRAVVGHVSAIALSRLDDAMLHSALRRFAWMGLILARRRQLLDPASSCLP